MSDAQSSIDELIAEFPGGNNRKAVITWLVKVFELWDEGDNGEVTKVRHHIASLVGKSCELFPNLSLPREPPSHQPGNQATAEWLIVFAINTLTDNTPKRRAINIWYFPTPATGWLK